MLRTIGLLTAGASLMAFSTPVYPATTGYVLRLQVPVRCTVQYQPTGYGSTVGQSIALGQFRESCNAPSGYQLIVSYTPGALRGAVLSAGEEQVILNGSGEAVVSRATGPRVRERAFYVTPGANGWDASQLQFSIVPVVA